MSDDWDDGIDIDDPMAYQHLRTETLWTRAQSGDQDAIVEFERRARNALETPDPAGNGQPAAPPALSRFQYSAQEWAEIEGMLRKALPPRTRLRRPTAGEDYGGIDGHWAMAGRCPVAIRIRRNRPGYAPFRDITFRDTEPARIAAGTYAPLELVLWFERGLAIAGKLIDVYPLAERADPPLHARPVRRNRDGTGFLIVEDYELVRAHALLFQGDRDGFSPADLHSRQRIDTVIAAWADR